MDCLAPWLLVLPHAKMPIVQVRDPDSTVIFSKNEIDTAELAFKNQISGKHTFCFSVSAKSRTPADSIGSPRAQGPLRSLQVDILVGETWDHERVTDEHVDELMENISVLQQKIQRLRSEVRHLRFREARHRETVESTGRRVVRYALAKMLVIIAVAVGQPMILAILFKDYF
jgi:hypothetical protein